MPAFRAIAAAAVLAATALLPTGSVPPPAPAFATVLQLNLCNSGMSACYTGRAIAAAQRLIVRHRPDVVTADEICESDLADLAAAMQATFRAPVGDGFLALPSSRTGEDVRCTNGERFGMGVVVLRPAAQQALVGTFSAQDKADPEVRRWLCLSDVRVVACTTHLSFTDRAVALAQCRELFGPVLAGLGERVVVAGDLNLRAQDAALCVQPDSGRADDASVQHAVTSADLVITSSATVDTAGTTDHPGLLVTVTRRVTGGGPVA